MRCLECNKEVTELNNMHLSSCSGLTLQEYAIRHQLSLDLLVNDSMITAQDQTSSYGLPAESASNRSSTILNALLFINALIEDEHFYALPGEIRRLDQLLWYVRELQVFGFQFRQEFNYTSTSHRVIADNRIKTLRAYSHKFPTNEIDTDLDLFSAVIVAQVGEIYSDYVFLTLPDNDGVQNYLQRLTNEYQIRWKALKSYNDSSQILYRTESIEDAQRLLTLVETQLREIPCASERFYAPVEHAMVSKELVFDSAHFIMDHPDKCENLHGGRYTLNVKVNGRIDPLTGFVIDYGYLKSVVKHRVIERLDHQTLNYASADLGWRSSTELLNVFIWEQLIDYLPGLFELQTFETTQSYCTYHGPSLEQMQKKGPHDALKHFSQPELGKSLLRKLLRSDEQKEFKVIS